LSEPGRTLLDPLLLEGGAMVEHTRMSGRVLMGATALVLALAGCGGAAESGGGEATTAGAASPEPAAAPSAPAAEPSVAASEGPSAAAAADVTVVLGEWVVEPTPASGDAGELAITADNQGGEDHELVVVRADDPADLPTDDDGAVDESQIPEEDFIGEIEELPSGDQRTSTFDMDAGSYVLFCNITEVEDDGEVESHFANGMATAFTVE
jgi:hypothetical protein